MKPDEIQSITVLNKVTTWEGLKILAQKPGQAYLSGVLLDLDSVRLLSLQIDQLLEQCIRYRDGTAVCLEASLGRDHVGKLL